MVCAPHPPSSSCPVPASALAKAVAVAFAVAIASGSWPALAQIDSSGSSSPHQLKWLPYRPAPAEPDRGQDTEARGAIEANGHTESASNLAIAKAKGSSSPSPASPVARAVFQAPADEGAQRAVATNSYGTRPPASPSGSTSRRSPAAPSAGRATFQTPADDGAPRAVVADGYRARASASQSGGTYRRSNSASRVAHAAYQAPAEGPQMPINRPAGNQYSDESPDIVPHDWVGGECYPADCAPGRCRPDWCGPCDSCYSPLHDRLWVRGEYLLWWTQGSVLPPLVTTGRAGTTPDVAGVLGQPGTSVIFGDSTVNSDAHSGGRITLGYWFEPCHCAGIEASYLGIGRETTSFFVSSP